MQTFSQTSDFVKRYSLMLFLGWTLMVALSLALNLYDLRKEVLREATTEAQAHLDLNLRYRKVVSSLGGLYVSPDAIAPNPFLTVPDRDITTRDGRKFTLINGAYLIRTVFETSLSDSAHPVLNRMVSLAPLNPANAPDQWEESSLRSFERGQTESSELSSINGRPYLRVMRPFITEGPCLKCHAAQGYQVGDIRGGISIAVPLARYYEAEAQTRRTILASHAALWLIVGVGLAVFTKKRQDQEQQITRNEWKLRVLSEAANDWVYWIDGEGRFVHISPSSLKITGYSPEEFMDNPSLLMNIVHPDDRELWKLHISDLQAPEHEELELRVIAKDGEMRWISHVCAPIVIDGKFFGRSASNRDITDRWKLGEQLRHAQKMEAVGLLAGGIAHDYNNILTAIIGYGNILKLKIPQDDPLSMSVEQILSSSARAASLTQSLLTFSRMKPINQQAVDLNAIVGRFEKFLTSILREDIELLIVPAASELIIMADQGQLEQVLMNLATNARDAMPQGGRLTISTDHFIMDDQFIRMQGVGRPGDYAVLTVADTGTGMDEAVRSRVFEPFFTTKELGRGTGLGLAMVYGAVQQNNGFITVASKPGRGATFTLYFPLLTAWGTGKAAPLSEAWERGTETVLIAEDDPVLRKLSCTVLKEFGYTTIEAADGEEAVDRFLERKDEILLVILDVIMPKMNGKEVYEELRKVRPGLKALFMSGYAADIVHEKGILDEGPDFLAKPIAPQLLLKKVREVLGPRS